MVWSKQDFEREVRRQLVEIESLRKRVPPNPEIHARIDRLEASHGFLLRKLTEVFQAPPDAVQNTAQKTVRKRSSVQDATVHDGTVHDGTAQNGAENNRPQEEAQSPKRIAAAARVGRGKSKTSCTRPGKRVWKGAVCGESAWKATQSATIRLKKILASIKGETAPWTVSAQVAEYPSPTAKCASCGKFLLAGPLKSDEIVFHEHAWHHKACASAGQSFFKPNLLN